MIEADEIKDGLVLCLDPDELEANGGGSDTTDSIRVQGPHFFVCIAANEQTGNWVPLFSAPGRLRIILPNNEKSGHPKWCETETYFHGEQTGVSPRPREERVRMDRCGSSGRTCRRSGPGGSLRAEGRRMVLLNSFRQWSARS